MCSLNLTYIDTFLIDSKFLLDEFFSICLGSICYFLQNTFLVTQKLFEGYLGMKAILLSICTGILGIFDILQFEIPSLIFFSSLNWEKNSSLKYQVSKIQNPSNVISTWTKKEFPRFQFLWFTTVGVVNQGQLQEWTEHCLTAVLKIWNQ